MKSKYVPTKEEVKFAVRCNEILKLDGCLTPSDEKQLHEINNKLLESEIVNAVIQISYDEMGKATVTWETM